MPHTLKAMAESDTEVPCLLYGPGGGSEPETIPDEYTCISDMEWVANVLALNTLDPCDLPK